MPARWHGTFCASTVAAIAAIAAAIAAAALAAAALAAAALAAVANQSTELPSNGGKRHLCMHQQL